MEQHPVPQNVTTFQFRLIGDMTIKQFGYLAGGAILAIISYKLPIPFFFSWPLTLIFGIGGFGFAFVPIEERPMDIWVLSFIKSVYSPTQFIWQKEAPATVPAVKPAVAAQVARPASVPATTTTQKQDVLRRVFTPAVTTAAQVQTPTPSMIAPKPVIPQQTLPLKKPAGKVITLNPKAGPFDWIMQFFSFSVHPPAAPASPPVDFSRVMPRKLDISPPPVVRIEKTQQAIAETQNKEKALEDKLTSLKQELSNKTMTESRVLELQKQLTEVLGQKDKMEQELTTLRKQMSTSVPQVLGIPAVPAPRPASPAPPTAQHVAGPTTPHQTTVKIITADTAVKAGLPRLTTFPNIITGIIKDSENNFLPGVLVTAKDKDGIPLRALKTNRLGQFAASTPLANGVYFVEIEDPRVRYRFDRVQITLNGSIVPALEIIAKSEREINRAKLEKELFGSPSS